MFDFLGTNIGPIVEIITGVVGVFALIATLTPNDADNKIAQFLLGLVNKLGANFGNARNE